jgi:hypothetical protein
MTQSYEYPHVTWIHPNDSEQKLTKARTQLLLNQPFFGTLCVRLKPVPGPVPTMATNGRVIMLQPRIRKRAHGGRIGGRCSP